MATVRYFAGAAEAAGAEEEVRGDVVQRPGPTPQLRVQLPRRLVPAVLAVCQRYF